MVWRDVDFGVDAPGLSAEDAWAVMWPLLASDRCRGLHYENETATDEPRHYFVARIDSEAGDEWKVDVSIWVAGVPAGVEPFQAELESRLTEQSRLTILRLKDGWYDQPTYPDGVGGWEIYDAVLEHGVRTFDELDAYLRERGFPTRVRAGATR
jgi:hypothetical protein